MKRKLFLLTGIIFVLLSGCGKEKNSAVKDQFESGYMELFGTHPAVTKKGDFQVMEGIAYFTKIRFVPPSVINRIVVICQYMKTKIHSAMQFVMG